MEGQEARDHLDIDNAELQVLRAWGIRHSGFNPCQEVLQVFFEGPGLDISFIGGNVAAAHRLHGGSSMHADLV